MLHNANITATPEVYLVRSPYLYSEFTLSPREGSGLCMGYLAAGHAPSLEAPQTPTRESSGSLPGHWTGSMTTA